MEFLPGLRLAIPCLQKHIFPTGNVIIFARYLKEETKAERRILQDIFEKKETEQKNGVIVHSELLTDYLRREYPGLYLVSSTTKVLTEFEQFRRETDRGEFRYVVPDFRLNKAFDPVKDTQQGAEG